MAQTFKGLQIVGRRGQCCTVPSKGDAEVIQINLKRMMLPDFKTKTIKPSRVAYAQSGHRAHLTTVNEYPFRLMEFHSLHQLKTGPKHPNKFKDQLKPHQMRPGNTFLRCNIYI